MFYVRPQEVHLAGSRGYDNLKYILISSLCPTSSNPLEPNPRSPIKHLHVYLSGVFCGLSLFLPDCQIYFSLFFAICHLFFSCFDLNLNIVFCIIEIFLDYVFSI